MAELGFKYAETKPIGRTPYNPATLLKLYVYGYMNRVRSSRRLEAETQRNIEVMWLLEKLTPDDKTICNFRKDNSAALRKVFRDFSLWCSRVGFYGKELVAVDGTKIRANTNRHNIYTKKGTEKQLAETDAKIEKYMRELEETDASEANETKVSADTVKSILKH
jgi:transposase